MIHNVNAFYTVWACHHFTPSLTSNTVLNGDCSGSSVGTVLKAGPT